MSTVTLFCGAGASIGFGYPATLEFMNLTKNSIGSQVFNEVLEILKSNNEPIDIEKVLWELNHLNMFLGNLKDERAYTKWLFMKSQKLTYHNPVTNRQDTFESFFNFYNKETSTTISRINKLVYDTYWEEPQTEYINPYPSLLTQLGVHVDIFTTNYDLSIERTFWNDDDNTIGKFTDGFYYKDPTIEWSPNEFGPHIASTKLYKLHGSVNWKRESNGRIHRIPFHDFTRHEDHVIIYPGYKGVPEEEPFKTLHNFLSEKLMSAYYCLVIGYSFRDEYINRVFQDSMRENENLKIIIWNPTIPDHNFISFGDHRIIHFEKVFDEKYVTEIIDIISQDGKLELDHQKVSV